MLKKILFFFAFFFIMLTSINAQEPVIEYQDNIYSNRISDKEIYSGQLGYIVMNGEVIYCLDPYKIIGNNYFINNSYFEYMNQDDLTYMQAIANYVSDQVNNRNIYYYMAAQELIWDRIIGEGMTFWSTNSGDRININDYKNEIKNHLNNVLVKPSFDNQLVLRNFRDIVVLEDHNNVLNQYEIVSDNKNIVWKEGNKLYIKIVSSELDTIKLIKKMGSGDSIYYYSDNNQHLADLTSEYEIVSTFEVLANDEYNENVSINFVDADSLKTINKNVMFKIINIANDNVELDTYTSIGTYLTNLKQGNYKIQVYSVDSPYLISECFFNIDENQYIDSTRTIVVPLSKPHGIINVYNNDNVKIQIQGNNKSLDLDKSGIFELPLGLYNIIINSDNKDDIYINYIDDHTPIIIKDIYIIKQIEYTKEHNDIKSIDNIDNQNEKNDSKEKNALESIKEIHDTILNDQNNEDYIINNALPNTEYYKNNEYFIIILLCSLLILLKRIS